MGMFDYVHVNDKRFICSEGHDLCDAEFQSKDFGCTMGDVAITNGSIVQRDGGYGDPPRLPLLGRFYVYTDCKRCPALVQANTHNLVPTPCEFEIDVVDDIIRSITRTTPSTEEWLVKELTETWMNGCHGPMSYDEAQRFRQEAWAKERTK